MKCKYNCRCPYCLARIEQEFWAIVQANYSAESIAELSVVKEEEAK